MISEYHLACTMRGSATTSPIIPDEIEKQLPALMDYALPKGTGVTDVRVSDHKSISLHVGVWLHRMDMTLTKGKEASLSVMQSRHCRGHLLGYFLAPGTGNLRFEEVVIKVLHEN